MIIGTKSFGIGSVINTGAIPNGGMINLTVGEYLTADEEKIEGFGIEPDEVAQNPESNKLDEINGFISMIEEAKPGLGDMGLNVYGAQQRLALLGYNVYATGKLDEATFGAIKSFQASGNLYPYGVLDWTTRDALNARMEAMLSSGDIDYQLEKATEMLREK
jgi:carboxyl-terminal processing protease